MTRFLTRLDPIRHRESPLPAFLGASRAKHSVSTVNSPDLHRLCLPVISKSSSHYHHRFGIAHFPQHNNLSTPRTIVRLRTYSTAMTTGSPSLPPGTSAEGSSSFATASSQSGSSEQLPPRFVVSPIPPNPLGEGRCIRTAAALIIGDEILNGKTLDSNSHVFAQFCFQHGIDLKRVEVIPDDENEIIEASRRLSGKYDFVVTSGGIGPTHDDITYESLAKAFNTRLVHHDETIRRMKIMNQYRKWATLQTPEQKAATLRMALFPENAEVIFVDPEIWVPVVRLGGNLCVFPGVPGLFRKMLHSVAGFLPLPPKSERPLRIQIYTDRAESLIAPYLTSLQERLRPHNIQVGSYPILYKGVFVSLIGRDLPPPPSPNDASSSSSKPNSRDRVWIADVAREVEREIGGRVLSEEEIEEQKKELSAEWVGAKQALNRKEDGLENATTTSATSEIVTPFLVVTQTGKKETIGVKAKC